MLTKTCSKCKEPKSIDEFYFRNKTKGTRNHYCIPCLKGYKDAHYRNNVNSYKTRCGARRDRIRKENKRRIFNYLVTHPCVDCGETSPVVLDFDHKNPKTKTGNVTRMLTLSWNSIALEISKCEIRCSNCHRKRTAIQTNCIYLKWYP